MLSTIYILQQNKKKEIDEAYVANYFSTYSYTLVLVGFRAHQTLCLSHFEEKKNVSLQSTWLLLGTCGTC